MKASESVKRPVGRPPSDPSGTQVAKTVRLTPAEVEYLTRVYGSVNAGVRALVTRDMGRAKG